MNNFDWLNLKGGNVEYLETESGVIVLKSIAESLKKEQFVDDTAVELFLNLVVPRSRKKCLALSLIQWGSDGFKLSGIEVTEHIYIYGLVIVLVRTEDSWIVVGMFLHDTPTMRSFGSTEGEQVEVMHILSAWANSKYPEINISRDDDGEELETKWKMVPNEWPKLPHYEAGVLACMSIAALGDISRDITPDILEIRKRITLALLTGDLGHYSYVYTHPKSK